MVFDVVVRNGLIADGTGAPAYTIVNGDHLRGGRPDRRNGGTRAALMIENLFSLGGRVALVTGRSRGIGKMIAAGFIE